MLERPDEVLLPPPGRYLLDPVHTFAGFRVKHMIVGLVDGRFNTIEGEFVVTDDAERLFDRIDARVDAASVDTKVEARDEDLRSDRFFDVRTFPLITFTGVDCALVGNPLWTVTGELTIRDAARVVALEVTVRGATVDPHGRTRIGLTATTPLARGDFDLTTELAQESGPEGGFDVEVRVDVEAVLDDQGAKGD